VVASRQPRDNNHMPVGWFLAIISGLLFTTNNFFVKLLEMDAAEVLLVRSALKTVVLGLLLSAPGAPSLLPSSWSDCIFTWLQGICSGVRLLLQLACLHYLPLGDALTLIFTEPLWTVVASKLVLGTRIGPWKFCFALLLLTGMFLCIQPPFLFGVGPEEGSQDDVINGTNSSSNSTTNSTSNHDLKPDEQKQTQFENLYFVGAGLALGSALTGAASNVLIAKCHQVSSTVMVFYSGVGGVFLSILSGFSDPSNRILFHITSITTSQWVVLGVLGVAGVLGYFCLTRSLQAILLLIEKKSRNIKYLFFELVDTTDDCGCAQGYGDHHLLSYTGSGDGGGSQQPRPQRLLAGRPQRARLCLGTAHPVLFVMK